MRDDSADLVFSDPPFNVKIDGHATGNGSIRHREFAMAAGEMTRGDCRCRDPALATLHRRIRRPQRYRPAVR
jgi:hypothetical protein